MWIAVQAGLAAHAVELPPLAHAAEVPQERLYAGLQDDGGPVLGLRRQRRSAAYLAWELEDGTIVRTQHTVRRVMVEDRRFDASGWPVSTLTADADGPQQLVVHTQPGTRVPLAGWTPQPVPLGTLLAPFAAETLPGDIVRLSVLQGELSMWVDSSAATVTSPGFVEGLAAGCGCRIEDRVTTWVDNRPGVRVRLRAYGASPTDALDVWAIPHDDGVWVASFRVAAPTDATDALAPGRALIHLMRWSEHAVTK